MLSRRQMMLASGAALAGLRPAAAGPTTVLDPGAKPDDGRLGPCVTLNGHFPFRVPKTLAEWEARRTRLREQLLVANGLWPLPEKTPLNPVVRQSSIKRDGYTISQVAFASMPGHYVTGNLYRPINGKDGPAPAVLFAHGHWKGGRFEVADDRQVQRDVQSKAEATETSARYFMQAIPATLAQLGFVVFQYDMVGYADSTALPHADGFADVAAELRLQSAMGLQTWNSVRALDFVTGLPGVDPKRVGMTGASGGGTQTFVLGAIDDRLAAIFPAVMVSAAMQGGCVCENCSLLRVGTGNVELAALFAPKPMATSCADDWTKDFLKDGYGLPELKRLYALYGKPNHVAARAWPQYPHNYNQPAREFMYEWFRTHLMNTPGAVTEPTFEPVPVKELAVFDADHPRPKDEVPVARLRETRTAASDAVLAAARPDDRRADTRAALRAMVCDELPKEIAVRKGPLESKVDGVTLHRAVLGRKDEKDAVPFAGVFGPKFDGSRRVVWVHPDGKASLFDGDKLSAGVRKLVDAGIAVVAMDVLGVGELSGTPTADKKEQEQFARFAGYRHGYNRTLLAERVHDVLTGVSFGKFLGKAKRADLIGWGAMGPVAVLAKALAGDAVAKTAADLNGFDFSRVTTSADPMMLPGAVKYGGMAAFLALCGRDVLAHNPPDGIDGPKKLANAKVIDWLLG